VIVAIIHCLQEYLVFKKEIKYGIFIISYLAGAFQTRGYGTF